MENSAVFRYKTEKPKEAQTQSPSISVTPHLLETGKEIKGDMFHP